MFLDRHIIPDRHELQRPEHNLSKMTDDEVRIGGNWIGHVHSATLRMVMTIHETAWKFNRKGQVLES